jgi:hypothetical protein
MNEHGPLVQWAHAEQPRLTGGFAHDFEIGAGERWSPSTSMVPASPVNRVEPCEPVRLGLAPGDNLPRKLCRDSAVRATVATLMASNVLKCLRSIVQL